MLERRRLAAAQRRDDAGEDHRHAVAAGVDDAGLAQDRQQLGTAADALLPAATARSRIAAISSFWTAAAPPGRAARRLGHVRELGGDLAAISRMTVSIVPSAGSRTES